MRKLPPSFLPQGDKTAREKPRAAHAQTAAADPSANPATTVAANDEPPRPTRGSTQARSRPWAIDASDARPGPERVQPDEGYAVNQCRGIRSYPPRSISFLR
jgi:hypothetical protein